MPHTVAQPDVLGKKRPALSRPGHNEQLTENKRFFGDVIAG